MLQDDDFQAVLAGQTRSYQTTVDNGRIQVEALPLRGPLLQPGGSDSVDKGPIIGILLATKSLGEADRSLLLLRVLLLTSGLAVLAAALVGGGVIAANVLRPLSEVVKTARTIATSTQGTKFGNLSQRVPRLRSHDEMAQVVDTFNEMLAALEGANKAQRRFIADASHELRAPLTTIQGNLAFLQRYIEGLPPEERRTVLSDAHSETLRLARLVDELLLLARADANTEKNSTRHKELAVESGEKQPQTRPVELDHALLQLVRQLRGRGEPAPCCVDPAGQRH